MDVKKTVIFDEQEKQTMRDVVSIVNEICMHFDDKCSQCPFSKICDVSSLDSVFTKLINEGQVIIE